MYVIDIAFPDSSPASVAVQRLILQSIHKKMGPGSSELLYLANFQDFIVHSAVLRSLKFEQGSKKGT